MADGVFGVEVVTPEQSLLAGGARSVVLRHLGGRTHRARRPHAAGRRRGARARSRWSRPTGTPAAWPCTAGSSRSTPARVRPRAWPRATARCPGSPPGSPCWPASPSWPRRSTCRGPSGPRRRRPSGSPSSARRGTAGSRGRRGGRSALQRGRAGAGAGRAPSGGGAGRRGVATRRRGRWPVARGLEVDVAQTNEIELNSASLVSAWLASILRSVPDFERMTSDCGGGAELVVAARPGAARRR